MTVADDVTLDDLILAKDDLSGADIKVRVSLALHHELRSKTASLVKHVGIALSTFKHHILDGCDACPQLRSGLYCPPVASNRTTSSTIKWQLL